jgi:DNA-3-methyladenine glycosylase
MHGQTLSSSFYNRDVPLVARELLGKLLVRRSRDGLCLGRIVETEAYLAKGDSACHASRGKTKKNATMFGSPGLAYVYSIHARYCLNAVTQQRDCASAVLIRAVEPLGGIEQMQRRRGTEALVDLCRGPARLCEAFDIDRNLDGFDMTRGSRLWIAEDESPDPARAQITTSGRIGVSSAQKMRLRFFVDGSPFVSGLKRLHRRKPSR